MGVYKKILVAIDTSEDSWYTLEEAVKVIRNKDTWAVVLTVAPQFRGDLGLVFNDIHARILKPYENLLAKAQEYFNKERILSKFLLEEGDPYEKIVDIAYSENCDLIVLGKRRSNFQRLLLGSTTARVIGYSPVDVLVIPARSKVSWGKMLVAIDQSSYSEKAFSKALKLGKFYNSELYLLSVIDLPFEAITEAPELYETLGEKLKPYLQDLQNQASSQGIQAKIFIKEGDPAEEIIKFSQEKEIEIIVMGSYGKTGLKRLLMGSVTEKVITLSEKPVLVVKS
ncbi:MAG: universal stress protein [Caldimicrobium sp.]|jgi:nucleotide-binding universal stress UspA family protein